MLAEIDCDAVAVGDYYGRRGEIILAALAAGKHVIADKPICTRQSEREQIAELARSRNLRVGCQLDLRDSGHMHAARRLIRNGAVGQVHTIIFDAQHPLMYGTRPGWYFEPGRHGGTINDIAIHAVDLIPWITGRKLAEVVAARVWNGRLKEAPHFQDGAQMLLRMDNDGGVMGDVSYFAPDSGGYDMPQYWRITFHGDKGVLEVSHTQKNVMLGGGSREPIKWIGPDPMPDGGYFDAFLRDIAGASLEGDSTTETVLEAARVALAIQDAADKERHDVPL